MAVTRRPQAWFWVVVVLLLLWQAMGLYSFYEHVAHGPAAMGAVPTDYDRQLFASLPGWYVWVFGIATWGALATGVALILRRREAVTLAAISLLATVVMFGWMFLATDIIAAKGVWTTYFPAVIIIVGGVSLWFANMVRARGWIA
ncbi:hypothetical protein [Sphingomonas radiodurans]|uniref:hypothetical protein n=1 Tax=Sphingomonas radiodurans TaxID=2890321 RepID=UPI001E3C0F18|nr:hypothetical protein [Sphingomonas radiodurans]WBH16325.1 hypothetical protein LLW23_16240 [Sphingomonas radiodurans]